LNRLLVTPHTVIVDPQAVDARLATRPPHHVRHPHGEVSPRQPFHHRPLPPDLDAAYREQAALIVPTYVARAAARAEDAVRGQDAKYPASPPSRPGTAVSISPTPDTALRIALGSVASIPRLTFNGQVLTPTAWARTI
jgi:hypothetical protein